MSIRLGWPASGQNSLVPEPPAGDLGKIDPVRRFGGRQSGIRALFVDDVSPRCRCFLTLRFSTLRTRRHLFLPSVCAAGPCFVHTGHFRFYCGVMPAFLIMRSHLSISAFNRRSSAAGVARSSSTGDMLSSAKRFASTGSLSAFCRAPTNASTIGVGVLRGVYIPYQVVTSNPGTPASAEVGRFGKVGTRFLLVIA